MPTEDLNKVHVIARTMFRSPADGGTITIVDIQDDAGNLLGSARGVDSPTKIAGMALAQMEARLASARVKIAACGLLPPCGQTSRFDIREDINGIIRVIPIHPDPADLI